VLIVPAKLELRVLPPNDEAEHTRLILPPALKKYLACWAEAKVTLVSTNWLIATLYAAFTELKVLVVPVTVVPTVAADALLVYAELMLDCIVLKYVITDPAVGAAIPVPEPD
jgi:hypothetical protein